MPEAPDIKEPIPIDYAERRRQRASERTSRERSRPLPLMAIGISLLAVLLVLVGFETFASAGKVHPGVTVSGVEVGGMLPEKALLVIESGLTKKSAAAVTVVHNDNQWRVEAAEIGLNFDSQALVDEAMAVGRTGGPLMALGARVKSWTAGTRIDASGDAAASSIDTALSKIAEGTDVKPVDASVKIEGTVPQIVASKDGLILNRPAASAAILRAFLSSNRTVEAPVITNPVAVDNSEAEEAAKLAEQMLAGPASVTLGKRSWTFEPDQIAQWIVFRRSDNGTASSPATDAAAVSLEARVSPKRAAKTVTRALGTKVGREAVDARFKTSNGEVSIVPSRNGVGPDLDALATELTQVLTDPAAQRSVQLRTTVTEPEVTTAEARDMGIKKRISVYTTTYAGGNKPRTNNIHTLGDALDGTLVAPGETFSFNGTVGQRTAAKGYQEASAIVNGKLVPQLGGGICQVGTTIFNAVFESGFPVLDRRNHSFYISHYPKGRDATISWGGPDFKFKNDSDNWVLISVSYTSSSITIALYGTDPGYEVDAETSEWRNIKPFPVTKIKDPKIEEGGQVVEDSGVKGRSITVKRIVTKDDKVVRTDEFVSVYKPKAEVLRVGTKVVEDAESAEDDSN